MAGEYDTAQDKGEDEKRSHGDYVDFPQVLDPNQDPYQDQAADDQAPAPPASPIDASCRKGAVVYHDGSPPHQLKHIKQDKQKAAPFPKTHFHGFHCALSRISANQAGQEQKGAANHMPQQDGGQPPAKSQRRKICTCQYLCNGHPGPKPD